MTHGLWINLACGFISHIASFVLVFTFIHMARFRRKRPWSIKSRSLSSSFFSFELCLKPILFLPFLLHLSFLCLASPHLLTVSYEFLNFTTHSLSTTPGFPSIIYRPLPHTF